MTTTRTFDDRPAVRERVPLLLGLVGPSGSGKTFSALRLASGMQRVGGGEIFVIDTEARRALHYADKFKFRHVAFGAPFSSLDYLAAIEHCVSKGAGVVVVDSMSHEHEGPGGLLERHEREVQRMSRGDERKAERVKMLAWQKPKADRRRLINTILQLPCNFIFCFRAKEKLLIKSGKEPAPQGWMAIAGDEFVYEMSVNALLLPGACGVPTWRTEDTGSRQQIKRPGWAHGMFDDNAPLDERTGEALARWASGDVTMTPDALRVAYERCSSAPEFGALQSHRKAVWASLSADERRALKAAADAAEKRVKEALEEPPLDVPESAPASPELEAALVELRTCGQEAQLTAWAMRHAALIRGAGESCIDAIRVHCLDVADGEPGKASRLSESVIAAATAGAS